jgi:hypothetical protein
MCMHACTRGHVHTCIHHKQLYIELCGPDLCILFKHMPSLERAHMHTYIYKTHTHTHTHTGAHAAHSLSAHTYIHIHTHTTCIHASDIESKNVLHLIYDTAGIWLSVGLPVFQFRYLSACACACVCTCVMIVDVTGCDLDRDCVPVPFRDSLCCGCHIHCSIMLTMPRPGMQVSKSSLLAWRKGLLRGIKRRWHRKETTPRITADLRGSRQ